MKTATCTAVVRGDRINLVIDNGENGAKEFARVLKLATDRGLMTWRGDITDENGKERRGWRFQMNKRPTSEYGKLCQSCFKRCEARRYLRPTLGLKGKQGTVH